MTDEVIYLSETIEKGFLETADGRPYKGDYHWITENEQPCIALYPSMNRSTSLIKEDLEKMLELLESLQKTKTQFLKDELTKKLKGTK